MRERDREAYFIKENYLTLNKIAEDHFDIKLKLGFFFSFFASLPLTTLSIIRND